MIEVTPMDNIVYILFDERRHYMLFESRDVGIRLVNKGVRSRNTKLYPHIYGGHFTRM